MQARYIELYEGVQPQPGDLFHLVEHEAAAPCPHGWTNCDGRHLHGLLPNGQPWELTSRSPKCAMPEDHTHRCWCVLGTAPRFTACAVGPSCGVGELPVEAGDWKGWLWDGFWTGC